MQSKELSTVRVSNVSPGLHKRELEHFFESHGLRAIQNISLCPSSFREDAPLVGTVTFRSPSDAKRALNLNEKILGRLRASVERDFMGLTVLGAPTDSELDIVAVHGLNGHAFGTWTCHDENQVNLETMWLRDFLPAQIRGARVLTYGYNSALLGPNTSVSTIRDFAFDLLRRILADRDFKQQRTRPLIFVCHSLGGIVVKQALICAHASPGRYNEIEAATRSILFLATPHGGSKSANVGSLLANVAALAFQRPRKQLLHTLKYESDVLSRLSEDFRAIHHPFDIINFYERRTTSILNSLVVDETSAQLGVVDELLIPIDADHRRICKFNNPSDPRYLLVLAELRRCVEKATRSRESGIPAKPVPANRLPAAQAGHFVVPLPINPQFMGRESELRLLDEHLCAKEGETDLTHPIVAIHGLGGVRKTQLANKYVHDRKKKLPKASIFWITARSEDEIKAGLQAIADKLVLEFRVEATSYERSKVLQSEEPVQQAVETSLDLMYKCLRSPLHEGWLLVLDNYDDVRVNVRAILPAGMRGAVLITSRDRKIIGSVAISGLALSAMDADDARHLFLDIQDSSTGNLRNKTTAHPEAEVLEDILKELQCFPLAIDQAASFIRENSPMTFREYLEYLKPRSVNRELLLRFKQANPLYPESVMTTWEISLEYLERTQPRACKILQILGFLNQDHIAEDLLTMTTKEIAWLYESPSSPKRLPDPFRTDMQYLGEDVGFRVAIGTLVSFSLIRRDPAGPTLQVHPLVHEWIRVRLNTDPGQQARLTICATLILYQSFPLELVAWIPDASGGKSNDALHRVDRVVHHITSVLENLRDYHVHAETLPLECFVLCEILTLAQAPAHLGHSNVVFPDLDQVIRAIIPSLAQYQQPIAHVIHKAVMWLRSHSWKGGSVTSVNEIIDALKALLPTFPVENSPDPLWLLLVTLATDISSCFDRRESAVPPSDDPLVGQDERHRRIRIRIFEALKPFGLTNSPTLSLHQWVSMIINNHIIKILNTREFANQTYLNSTQIVSPSVLRIIPFDQRVPFLCRLTQLLWEYPKAKDFESLKAVLLSAVSEYKAALRKVRRASREQQDSELIKASSYSSYISSSRGRHTGPGRTRRIVKDFVEQIAYIRASVDDIAKAISHPRVCWRTPIDNHGKENCLNLEQRRWALELLSAFRKLRATVTETSAASHRTCDIRCDVTLSVVYRSLEDWPMLRVCVPKTLQFESIVKFCESSHPRPWVSGQVPSRREEPQGPASALSTDRAVGSSIESFNNPMLKASSALLQLGIPESCRCICIRGIEAAIAAAVVLVEKEGNLPSAEISSLQLHLSVLSGIRHDPTRYLSRLEIIYKLACYLPVISDEELRRSPLEAWDDEQSDSSTDSVDFGN